MPKRNRNNEQRKARGPGFTPGAAPNAAPNTAPNTAGADEQTRAVALFAASLEAHRLADQAERQKRHQAAEREHRHQQLRDVKQSAVDTLRRLRSAGATREKVAGADATYRCALAELQQFETGIRPGWAPSPETDGDRSERNDLDDRSELGEPQPS